MADHDNHEVTRLIAAWHAGDEGAREVLMSLVYENVRAIAGHSLRQMPAATLGATDVAHEALLRLLGADAPWQSRKHFFHVVAQATRQVLVDAARKRMAQKRGGGIEHVELDKALDAASPHNDATLVRLDEALNELARANARRAQIIELVYFCGLDRSEVARTLDVSEGTVDRDLRLARAWLCDVLET